jgi:drug/metabolite transporter (DMT)-like permease
LSAKGNPHLRGVLGMMGSAALFSAMAFLIRYDRGVSSFTAALFRFVIGACTLATLALFRLIRLEFRNRLVLFLRGLFGGTAVLLFYLSIVKIGIAKGTVISYTFPVFATLGGVVFLRDRVRPAVWIFMAVSLVGLLLLAGPSWASGGGNREQLWIGLAFLGAVLSGLAIVCIKSLTATDSPYAIFMSQCAVGFWIVLLPANVAPSNLGWVPALLLLGIGLAATAGQLLMTWSFGYVPISTGSLLSLLTPTLNVLLGLLLFRETMTVLEIAGTSLILLSCTGVALLGREPLALRR